jgi:hypothetical protein
LLNPTKVLSQGLTKAALLPPTRVELFVLTKVVFVPMMVVLLEPTKCDPRRFQQCENLSEGPFLFEKGFPQASTVFSVFASFEQRPPQAALSP